MRGERRRLTRRKLALQVLGQCTDRGRLLVHHEIAERVLRERLDVLVDRAARARLDRLLVELLHDVGVHLDLAHREAILFERLLDGLADDRHEALHALEQHVEGDRLVEVVLRARAELLVLLEDLVAGLGGEDDEGDVLELVRLLELLADQEAVDAAQLDRQQDEIRPLRRRALDAEITILDDLDVRPERLEASLESAGEIGIGVDHQDPLSHGRRG